MPDLLNTRFTIVETGLFDCAKHLEAKMCRFQTFLDNMAMFIMGDNM